MPSLKFLNTPISVNTKIAKRGENTNEIINEITKCDK